MEDARFEQDRLAMMTAHLSKGAEPFSMKALDQPIGYQASYNPAVETSSSLDGASATMPHAATSSAIPAAIKAAMNRARIDNGDRAEAMAELRGAEFARLEMLHDALKPLIASLPPQIDQFECAFMPGEHPKLYIDMISFVEMARDRRTYRFIQDTRVGRIVLCESEKISVMEEAVTNYIGRRLVEREMLLASLQSAPVIKYEPKVKTAQNNSPSNHSLAISSATSSPTSQMSSSMDDALFQGSLQEAATTAPHVAMSHGQSENHAKPRRKSFWKWLGLIYFTAIDILGAVALYGILIALGVGAWHYLALWLGLAGQ